MPSRLPAGSSGTWKATPTRTCSCDSIRRRRNSRRGRFCRREAALSATWWLGLTGACGWRTARSTPSPRLKSKRRRGRDEGPAARPENEACLRTPKCAHCYNCVGMPVNNAAGMQTRPSRLYLPKFDSAPHTIFEYLLARFPQVNAAIWRERVSRGLIMLSDGTALEENSPYRHGMTVFYRKEVPSEPPSLEEPLIVYR